MKRAVVLNDQNFKHSVKRGMENDSKLGQLANCFASQNVCQSPLVFLNSNLSHACNWKEKKEQCGCERAIVWIIKYFILIQTIILIVSSYEKGGQTITNSNHWFGFLLS